MKNYELTIDERKALQKLAREQLKCKLLNDIKQDIIVCKLEGWNYTDYINELIALLKGIK